MELGAADEVESCLRGHGQMRPATLVSRFLAGDFDNLFVVQWPLPNNRPVSSVARAWDYFPPRSLLILN